MNAIVIPAAQKKIVVIGGLEPQLRTSEFDEFYHRAVAVIEYHRPMGHKVGIMVPATGGTLVSRLANHFGGRIIECDSLLFCESREDGADVCECLRELLGASDIGLVSIVAPQRSAQRLTEELMNRLRRPKKNLRHERATLQPLFVF